MKVTMIHRNWPVEEEADVIAAQQLLEAEFNRTLAARDLQRNLQDLQYTAEMGDLTDHAHTQLTTAIAALQAAVQDQWQAVRG